MRVLLTTSLLVLAVCSVHCMQDDNNQQPSSTGSPGANANTGTPPKFDKNTAVRNGVGNFFAQLNNDLLYLRDFILANIGEVGQTCGCERSVLAPFLPPYAGPGGQPGGPGVPPGGPRAPGAPSPPGPVPGAAAAVNNAGNLNPRAGTVPKNG